MCSKVGEGGCRDAQPGLLHMLVHHRARVTCPVPVNFRGLNEAQEELLPGAIGVSPAPPDLTPALHTGLRGCWGEVAGKLLHSSVCPARD